MKVPSSRNLALALVAMMTLSGSAAEVAPGIQLGLQSWTCRKLTFEQTVDFAARHHISQVELFPKHLNPVEPPAELERKKRYLRSHGITCYAYGVARTSMDPVQNRTLFEFARRMGIRLVLVAPENLAEWDGLEALAREYDIRLAIHNEGPGTPYSDPAFVRRLLARLDRRIGVCLDVGHLTESGYDAADTLRAYHGRVFDVHLKDKIVRVDAGTRSVRDTMLGEGGTNFRSFFAEIAREHWTGVMALETDSPEYAAHPDEFVDGAIAFFRRYFPDASARR